jgi:hypothetical protein
MDQEETYKALKAFRDHVVKQARANLTRGGKKSSGNLYESIDGEVKAMPNSIGIYFEMEQYGAFVDKGVRGANPSALPEGSKNRGVQKAPNSPYSFGTRSGRMNGLTKGLDSWIVRKGIAPRAAGGKFTSRKTLKFLMARSIYLSGIKPSLFFTNAFESAYKKLPTELIDKYGLDVEKLVTQALKEISKKK